MADSVDYIIRIGSALDGSFNSVDNAAGHMEKLGAAVERVNKAGAESKLGRIASGVTKISGALKFLSVPLGVASSLIAVLNDLKILGEELGLDELFVRPPQVLLFGEALEQLRGEIKASREELERLEAMGPQSNRKVERDRKAEERRERERLSGLVAQDPYALLGEKQAALAAAYEDLATKTGQSKGGVKKVIQKLEKEIEDLKLAITEGEKLLAEAESGITEPSSPSPETVLTDSSVGKLTVISLDATEQVLAPTLNLTESITAPTLALETITANRLELSGEFGSGGGRGGSGAPGGTRPDDPIIGEGVPGGVTPSLLPPGLMPGEGDPFALNPLPEIFQQRGNAGEPNVILEDLGKGLETVTNATDVFREHLSQLNFTLLKDGKFSLDSLKASVKNAADSILNDLVNNALNALLDKIFDIGGASGGSGGVGGVFSKLFGSFEFAKGGIMTPRGPLPLKAYARGGIANSPQLALFGEGRRPEAYVPLPDGRRIPVVMQGMGQGGAAPAVTQNIHLHFDTTLESVDTRIRHATGPLMRAAAAGVAEAKQRDFNSPFRG